MKRWALGIGLLSALVMSAGCMGGTRVAQEPGSGDPDSLRQGMAQRLNSEQPETAIPLMEEALTNEAFADEHVVIFKKIIALHLNFGDVESAQARYLSAHNSPAWRESAFGLIETHLLEAAAYAELTAWIERLRQTGLPSDQQQVLARWQLDAYRALGSAEKAAQMVPRIMADFEALVAERLFAGHLDRLLTASEWTGLHVFLAALETAGRESAWADRLARVYRIREQIKRERLAEAVALFRQGIPELVSAGSAGIRALRETLRLARAQEALVLANMLCEDILRVDGGASALKREAATQAVRLARDQRLQPSEVYRRLTRALDMEVHENARLHLTHEALYDIMKRGTPEIRRRMLVLCESLYAAAASDSAHSEAAGLLLDACFMAGEFERALAVVAAGIPGMTEPSHAILTAKVKAHVAMQGRRHEEAIRHFRDFMVGVKAADRRESEGLDPFTGLHVSREEVLALNAERIAGLWRTLGKASAAAEAMAEAKAYLQAALERLPEDSSEHRAVRQKLEAWEAVQK